MIFKKDFRSWANNSDQNQVFKTELLTILDNKAHQAVCQDQFKELDEKVYSSKKTIDLLLGSIALLFFGIFYPLIALGIKISSRGPVLFKQKRTGKNGQVFICYKFRTMHVLKPSQKNGKPVVTIIGDSRLFSFGKFLRKTNLDELPQLLNVLKGEMSLVGPRPYTIEECAYWNKIFEDHYFRYLSKPGITGLAQSQGYRGGTLDKNLMRERLDYDLIYIENPTLLFDLRIIFNTVKRMVFRDTNGH